MKNDIYEQVKTIQKLEQEVTTLEGLDRIKRKGYGQNFVIRRIKDLINDLNLLILGECKYGRANFCLIEKTECNVIDKENCAVRLAEDTKRSKPVEGKGFAEITKYKKNQGRKR